MSGDIMDHSSRREDLDPIRGSQNWLPPIFNVYKRLDIKVEKNSQDASFSLSKVQYSIGDQVDSSTGIEHSHTSLNHHYVPHKRLRTRRKREKLDRFSTDRISIQN